MSESIPVRPGQSRAKILFVGQCLMSGYGHIDPSLTFVGQALASLERQYPQLSIKFAHKHLHHPKGLQAILRHRLLLSRPDIIVISAVASFAAIHTRVNLLYEMAPEVIDTTRGFLQKIQSAVTGMAVHLNPETAIDKFIAYHPPLAIDEYERILMEGVELCQKHGVRVVVVGPGRFNEDVPDNFSIPFGRLPGVFYSVNEMARRVGSCTNVPVVDAQGALSEHSGDIFIRNNIRWNQQGHKVVARELELALTSEIFRLSSPQVGEESII